MKLGFSAGTRSIEEQRLLFSQFSQAGFAGLQLKSAQYSAYLDRPKEFIAEWGGSQGAFSGLIHGGLLDKTGRSELRKVIAFAEVIGSETVCFCHGQGRDGLNRRQIQDYSRILSIMGEEARTHGVRLSLHHHYDNPVMHREDFDTFFEIAEPDTIGLTIDTAHLVKSGIFDIPEVIKTFGPWIDNFHAKDFANGSFKVLGRGDIDFVPIFAALNDANYHRWIFADEESGGDLVDGMRTCAAFLNEKLNNEWC